MAGIKKNLIHFCLKKLADSENKMKKYYISAFKDKSKQVRDSLLRLSAKIDYIEYGNVFYVDINSVAINDIKSIDGILQCLIVKTKLLVIEVDSQIDTNNECEVNKMVSNNLSESNSHI